MPDSVKLVECPRDAWQGLQGHIPTDLKVDYLRPARPGRLVARGSVRHRTRRLAFCEATVEQDGGEIVAEARAVIAYVKA